MNKVIELGALNERTVCRAHSALGGTEESTAWQEIRFECSNYTPSQFYLQFEPASSAGLERANTNVVANGSGIDLRSEEGHQLSRSWGELVFLIEIYI